MKVRQKQLINATSLKSSIHEESVQLHDLRKTTKKSTGIRNNSMVVLCVGHLSVCQTKRDSWFLGFESH